MLREIERWITIAGKHIPIYKGGDARKLRLLINENYYNSFSEINKNDLDYLNQQALQLDSEDRNFIAWYTREGYRKVNANETNNEKANDMHNILKRQTINKNSILYRGTTDISPENILSGLSEKDKLIISKYNSNKISDVELKNTLRKLHGKEYTPNIIVSTSITSAMGDTFSYWGEPRAKNRGVL